MGGGEIFGDDKISVRKFRFLPQIFGGKILLIGSKIQPPQMAAARKAAAGIAAADQCRHLLICFSESPKYPAREVVRKRPRIGHNGPVGTLSGLFLFVFTTNVEFIVFPPSATRHTLTGNCKLIK